MMSMADPVAIGMETLRIDNSCFLDKEFIELIRMNPSISIRLIHIMVVYVVL